MFLHRKPKKQIFFSENITEMAPIVETKSSPRLYCDFSERRSRSVWRLTKCDVSQCPRSNRKFAAPLEVRGQHPSGERQLRGTPITGTIHARSGWLCGIRATDFFLPNWNTMEWEEQGDKRGVKEGAERLNGCAVFGPLSHSGARRPLRT